jgi:hypothetical protein
MRVSSPPPAQHIQYPPTLPPLRPQVRVIASTRTPVLLRGFTISGSSLFPVLFAPYFAAVAADSPSGLPWSAYLLSLLFAVTNTALVNIQARRRFSSI